MGLDAAQPETTLEAVLAAVIPVHQTLAAAFADRP
jgi:hypothetical protein